MGADTGLPAWSVRLIDELDTADRMANDLARALSPAQLNWKPAEDLWSVGQCLQHLYIANEVYLPAIANALNDRPPSPVQEITPGWFGRWFIRSYIEPSPRSKRARAPRKLAPAQHIDPSVLDLFLRSNDVGRDLVRRAGPYEINRIRFAIPSFRWCASGSERAWKSCGGTSAVICSRLNGLGRAAGFHSSSHRADDCARRPIAESRGLM